MVLMGNKGGIYMGLVRPEKTAKFVTIHKAILVGT